MLYIPAKHLKPGMVLAQDLPSDLFCFSLLKVGHELTVKSIDRLREHGIQGAYVQSTFCSDTKAENFIAPEYKQELLTNIKKQFDDYLSQTGSTIGIYKGVSAMASDLVSYVLSKDEFLLNMIDVRDFDTYTYSHSMFVGLISVLIGIEIKLSPSSLVELAMSGLLHDIGKLDVPIEIVNKPAKLTTEEFTIMQEHPTNAVRRLKENRLFSYTVLTGIESHHERFDGTGYPRRLRGDKIPLFGRIMALADVYDALISKRSYREGWSSGQAIEYMTSNCDSHFDPDLLHAFLNVISAYPTGSIVSLSDDRLAVVVGNSPGNSLRPTIRILLPEEERNLEINLAENLDYLNVTVMGTLDDETTLPKNIF